MLYYPRINLLLSNTWTSMCIKRTLTSSEKEGRRSPSTNQQSDMILYLGIQPYYVIHSIRHPICSIIHSMTSLLCHYEPLRTWSVRTQLVPTQLLDHYIPSWSLPNIINQYLLIWSPPSTGSYWQSSLDVIKSSTTRMSPFDQCASSIARLKCQVQVAKW